MITKNAYATQERHLLTGLSDSDRYHMMTKRNPDGSTEGRDPNKIPSEVLECIGHHKRPLLAIMRQKCLDCCGEEVGEVAKCTSVNCALWPYRMGTNPHREKRATTEAQKNALKNRNQRKPENGAQTEIERVLEAAFDPSELIA
jgi:hypothetical protein